MPLTWQPFLFASNCGKIESEHACVIVWPVQHLTMPRGAAVKTLAFGPPDLRGILSGMTNGGHVSRGRESACRSRLIPKRHHLAWFFDFTAVLLGPELLGHFIDCLSSAHYSAERTMCSEPMPRGK
jgi:hypothetical protein